MAYFFEHHESLQFGIRRLLDEQLDHAIELLHATGSEQVSAVHEARKTIKRLRALLQLSRKALGEKRFKTENGRLRAVSHQLAPLRESAAMVELVARLAADDHPDEIRIALNQAHQQLTENQQRMEEQFFEDEAKLPQAAAGLRQIQNDLATLSLAQGDFGLIAAGLKRIYRQGKERMARAYRVMDNPDHFHDWRKRVKNLWHHVELLTPIWPPLLTSLSTELHQLSDLLGDGHDMAELAELVERFDAAGRETAGLQGVNQLVGMLNSKRLANEAAAFPLGALIYAESPAAFTERIARYWEIWQSRP